MAKKKKYFQRIEKNRKDEDSDGYLSSDDEEEVSDSMISKVIENQYIIIKYLGRGSFSKTWMVYDYLEDRFLALKLFENKFFEEFETEMFNFQKLKGSCHNNIINFYGSIEYKKDGNLMKGLLLELLGDSIEALLDEQYDNKITSNVIKNVTRDILNGLDFLHNKGLLHNDLKFDNILISKPNKKMEEYIGKIQDLKINQYYLEQINELTPVEIQLLDKKKRKMVKRKIREKANKVTVKKFRNNIIKINNSSLENLKLSIEEIQTTEEPTKQEDRQETFEEEIDKKLQKKIDKKLQKKIDKKQKKKTRNFEEDRQETEEDRQETEEDRQETTEEDRQETSEEVISNENIEIKDQIKKIELDLENISVKIIDLGNAENIGKMESDEILTRSYRPPENIINSFYDNKADVWVLGCLLYELFNGRSLFDLSKFKGKAIEKDRYHMALMYDALGKMPKDLAMECEYSEEIFDNKGRILKNKGIQERNLKSELCERINLDQQENDIIYNLLIRILNYDHKKRPTCKEILESEWYSKCD